MSSEEQSKSEGIESRVTSFPPLIEEVAFSSGVRGFLSGAAFIITIDMLAEGKYGAAATVAAVGAAYNIYGALRKRIREY